MSYSENMSSGGHGLVTYKNVDSTTGLITEELLCFADGARKLQELSLNIVYGGTGTAWYTMFLDPDTKTFKFKILENGVYIFDYDLGTGISATDPTISTLSSQINSLTNFSTTLGNAGGGSGDTTETVKQHF